LYPTGDTAGRDCTLLETLKEKVVTYWRFGGRDCNLLDSLDEEIVNLLEI
jgi:hypothetical protein